jgi:hypothetical protein
MPNAIKYNVSAETLALKKGNFWIGNGSVGKGPTSSTGYYNGITPPSGGYTIYLNKVSGGPSIYVASNDSQLISLTNQIAGASYTGVNQCFTYYYSQTDKVCVSQDYPSDFPYIVLDGLILYLDAGITLSYPGNGTTWTDVNGLGPNNYGSILNGPTFTNNYLSFDGTNDRVPITGTSFYNVVNPNPNQGDPRSPISVAPWYPVYDNFSFEFVCNPTSLISIKTEQNTGIAGVGGQRYIMENNKAADGANHGCIILSVGTNAIQVFSHGDGHMPCLLSYVGTTNTVTHICVTVSGKIPTLYINGSFVKTGIVDSRSKSELSAVVPGICSSYYPPFSGDIYLVRYYSKTLSSSEVLQNYNAQKSRFGL